MNSFLIDNKPVNILAFDIETIPDVNGIRLLNHLSSQLSDEEVVAYAQQQRRSETDSDFMPLYLHKVVTIAGCFRWENKIHVGSIGDLEDSEKDILQKFFNLFDTYQLQLVSWNGNGFDLPVLQHRALIQGVVARNFWEMGEMDSQFRWSNYINRYHLRHCDLMDILARYQSRAFAPLESMAKLCGFPGKLGMDGFQVWQTFQKGGLQDIKNYCEVDAMNTYLLFLRFQLMRGKIVEEEYLKEVDYLKQYLQLQSKKHLLDFFNCFTYSES